MRLEGEPVTNGQAHLINERVAVVEEIVRRLEARYAEHQATTETQNAKLDKLLAGQAEGARDRASIHAEIAAMKPHVETIKEAKLILKISKWVVAAAASGIAFLVAAKSWLALNINWFFGK